MNDFDIYMNSQHVGQGWFLAYRLRLYVERQRFTRVRNGFDTYMDSQRHSYEATLFA